MYIRNNVVRLRNYFWSGKTKVFIFSVCVCSLI